MWIGVFHLARTSLREVLAPLKMTVLISPANAQIYFVPYAREAIWPFASWTVIVWPVAMFDNLSTCPLGQSISTVSALVFDPMPKVSTSSLCEDTGAALHGEPLLVGSGGDATTAPIALPVGFFADELISRTGCVHLNLIRCAGPLIAS